LPHSGWVVSGRWGVVGGSSSFHTFRGIESERGSWIDPLSLLTAFVAAFHIVIIGTWSGLCFEIHVPNTKPFCCPLC